MQSMGYTMDGRHVATVTMNQNKAEVGFFLGSDAEYYHTGKDFKGGQEYADTLFNDFMRRNL